MTKYLKTSDIAKAIGVHSNTVRLYEEKGYLPTIPRTESGYRRFTETHLEQMRLAHMALRPPYLPGVTLTIDLVKRAADGDLGMAMELAYEYLATIRIEQTRAEAALEFLERWARGFLIDTTTHAFNIGKAAKHLGVTADQLRNWDRNGLIDIPRDPETGYRVYRTAEIGRLRVIRMLRQGGYSLMAILRMLRQFDEGKTDDLRQVLDTPDQDEGLETVADRWLSTLALHEERAQAIIQQITLLMEMT